MRNLFVYGTLMCEDIMEDVAGCLPVRLPGRLSGYERRVVKGEQYPGLVPGAAGRVDGLVYRDVPGFAWARLDSFEGDMYQRKPVLVELTGDGDPALTFLPLAPVRWQTVELDELGPITDRSGLVERAAAAFDELRGAGEQAAWMLRFVLRGGCPAAPLLEDDDTLEEIADELQARLGALSVELIAENVTRPMDVADWFDQPHLLGLALEVAAQARHDDDLVLRLSPAVLAETVGTEADHKRAYLRALLADIEPALADALLKEVV